MASNADTGEGVLRETSAMIRAMAPRLTPGRFAFRTVPGHGPADAPADAVAACAEDEGLSVVVPAGPGDALALRRITLMVHSALDGVGLSAAVAGALAGAGIACNVVAAHHHDHVFVPDADADRAMDVLERLSAEWRDN